MVYSDADMGVWRPLPEFKNRVVMDRWTDKIAQVIAVTLCLRFVVRVNNLPQY